MADHPRRGEAIEAVARIIVVEELEDIAHGYEIGSEAYEEMVDHVTDAVRGRVTAWYDEMAKVLDTDPEHIDGWRQVGDRTYIPSGRRRSAITGRFQPPEETP